MQDKHTRQRRSQIAPILLALLLCAGVGLGRIEPAGKNAGLLQFDVISELNTDEAHTNTTVFSRYWVCRDYYALSIVWSEPRGYGIAEMKTIAILSDETGFRIDDERYPSYLPTNRSYPKPLGDRGPFPYTGGIYEIADTRFAEAEALSRRVYAGDLALLKDASAEADGTRRINVPQAVGAAKRDLAQLKVHTRGERIESMELLDAQQQSLCRTRYEYEQAGNSSAVAKLVAELPVRPQKLAVDVNMTIVPKGRPEAKRTLKITEVDHVRHDGGRTCTVTYDNVAIGDTVLRLPVQVEVRNSQDKRLLRRARLINFKRVDVDKAGVWEAAKAFGAWGKEDRECQQLAGKYLIVRRRVGPLQVDPNDFDFVRKLIAKYPLPEKVQPPRESSSETHARSGSPDRDPQAWLKQSETRMRQLEESSQRRTSIPRPPRMDIEPNDFRVIRQLERYYRGILVPLTEEEKMQVRKGGGVMHRIPKSQHEISDLRWKLSYIQVYHRAPTLPEDLPPQMDPNDLERMRQLQAHYEALATQNDRGLGGRLKAIDCLNRLDRAVKDYDAFERRTMRCLQMLDEARLPGAYMVSGCGCIEKLVDAGQYDKANKLVRQWADKSAADNDSDAVYRFAGWDFDGQSNPWAAVHVLDRFLKKPGLSPMQRYEGLALRAIALDTIDNWLSDSNSADSEFNKAQTKWVLSTTSRQELAQKAEAAVREALSAWQSLGPARFTDAKPYSTSNMDARVMAIGGFAESTRLQETSAQLDQIVRRRGTGQAGPRR
jgi:sulfur carrier protein ThiS